MKFVILFTVFVVCINIIYVKCGRGGPCKKIRQKYPRLSGPKVPSTFTAGLCPMEKSCCNEAIASALHNNAKLSLSNTISEETAQAHGTLGMIKDMTSKKMKTMMGDLIPPDIAQRLDVEALGGHIWDYTMGKISSSELTIEVAVIGSGIILTDKAKPELQEMLECIVRELALHADVTFKQIASIIDDVLEAPRTFGYGFSVADTLLKALEDTQLTPHCSIGQIGGCHKCGNKNPGPCKSLCLVTTSECLSNVNNMIPLWTSWVESTVYLVKSMVSMIDLKIDPNDLVTPELIETLTNDIKRALFSANFGQCRTKRDLSKRSIEDSSQLTTLLHQLKKRSTEKFEVFSLSRLHKRAFDESAMLRTILNNKFKSLEEQSCSKLGAQDSDDQCWLGSSIGSYNNSVSTTSSQIQRETSPIDDDVATEIKRYEELVGVVSNRISEKLRLQALKPPMSDQYMMYSASEHVTYHLVLLSGYLAIMVL